MSQRDSQVVTKGFAVDGYVYIRASFTDFVGQSVNGPSLAPHLFGTKGPADGTKGLAVTTTKHVMAQRAWRMAQRT